MALDGVHVLEACDCLELCHCEVYEVLAELLLVVEQHPGAAQGGAADGEDHVQLEDVQVVEVLAECVEVELLDLAEVLEEGDFVDHGEQAVVVAEVGGDEPVHEVAVERLVCAVGVEVPGLLAALEHGVDGLYLEEGRLDGRGCDVGDHGALVRVCALVKQRGYRRPVARLEVHPVASRLLCLCLCLCRLRFHTHAAERVHDALPDRHAEGHHVLCDGGVRRCGGGSSGVCAGAMGVQVGRRCLCCARSAGLVELAQGQRQRKRHGQGQVAIRAARLVIDGGER